MSSPAKAAATVQNDILLVQYSPTGNGIGDLYAIVLSDLKKPLPFQIQRQTPDLQALKGPVASMSLATVPSSGGSSPAAAAVVTAPPFLDAVLSVNSADSTPQVWHINAPGRGVPPGATHSNPLAPLWSGSVLPSSFFPNTNSISIGNYAPQGSKKPGILAVLQTTSLIVQHTKLEYSPGSGNAGSPIPPNKQAAWKQTWKPTQMTIHTRATPQPSLIFHPTIVPPSTRGNVGFSWAVTGECMGRTDVWCILFLRDPPIADLSVEPAEEVRTSLAPNPCFASTLSEMVAVAGNQVYVNKFAAAVGKWDLVTPAKVAPSFQGPAVACTTSNNVVIVIVPDPNVQGRPEIHLFDLKTSSWSKAQLVQAPPGTFSDTPPIPPSPENSGNPGNGGPREGGSNSSDGPSNSGDPRTTDPSSTSSTNSHAALIGGIVGGIVVLGVLIFVVFFFRRRRSSKQKGQNQGGFALKSLDGDDGLHKMQRMPDGERSGRSDGRRLEANGRRLEANGYREKAWPSAGNPHEMVSSQARVTTRPRRNNPHAITYPPTFNQHEIALSQAGSPQESLQQRIINSQDMNWSPVNSHRRTASSRIDSPRKSTRPRVNGPHEVTRASTLAVVHRTNNPQYDPNQQP